MDRVQRSTLGNAVKPQPDGCRNLGGVRSSRPLATLPWSAGVRRDPHSPASHGPFALCGRKRLLSVKEREKKCARSSRSR